jgi:crotonobetaine/carnitine-CoA ligase
LSFGLGALPGDAQRFEERFGVHLVEYYGSTEFGIALFNDPPGRPGSVGLRGSTRVDLELRDERGRRVSDGDQGEAWIRPPADAPLPEYFDDDLASREANVSGWFRTGDILRADAEGYYFFIGRGKDSLRRRGKNIVPEDIERIADEHPSVLQSAAVAVPSEFGDDSIKLCVQWRDGAGSNDDFVHLTAWLAERLPRFMRPDYLQAVPDMPVTSTGKLMRVVLRSDQRPLWVAETGAWVAAASVQST